MNSRDFTVSTPEGRSLEVVQSGDPSWPAVIVQHGTPSSRRLLPLWLEDARRQQIQLIGYSRPGYGASTRLPGRRVDHAAADVRTLADELGLERFATWGYSGGGPHALAAAALLPDRVVAAAVVAGCAPYDAKGLDWTEGMGPGNVEEFGLVLRGEEVLRPVLEAQRGELLHASPLVALDSVLSERDRRVAETEMLDWLGASFAEAVSMGMDGMIDDDLEFTSPWGFELSSIEVPVQLWQGGQDLMVPISHGHWLAERIPGVDAHLLPAEGHLSLLVERVPEIHQWLLEHF